MSKNNVLCVLLALFRSRLFEPDSSGVFARHYSDEPSRRNVTAGRAYAGGPFAARAHATRKAFEGKALVNFSSGSLSHRLDFPRHSNDGKRTSGTGNPASRNKPNIFSPVCPSSPARRNASTLQ